MGKNNKINSFDKQFLDTLVEDESSCVEVKEQNYHLALHPFHLNNINESVKDLLNQGISKYDTKLGGILLGYHDIKLLSSTGAVSNDSFFIHMDVAAAFYLFKPEIGKILTGTVNKKSEDHVGCLVHKTFNVSLPKPAKIEDDDDDDDWLGSRVQIGHDILFRITFTNLEVGLPYIRAEFVSILSEQDSGISTSEENTQKKPKKLIFDSSSENELEIAQTKKKKKKRKHQESADEAEEQEDTRKIKKKNQEQNLEESSSKKKKSKHKKPSEVAENEHEETIESSNKKKKSKHKRNLSQSSEVEIDAALEKSLKKELLDEQEEYETHLEKSKHKHKHKQNSDCDNEIHKKNLKLKNSHKATTKKHKKKHEDTIQDLEAAALERALHNIGESSTTKTKKEKKLKHHSESDPDVSLPDLNLSNLFKEKNVSTNSKPIGNFLMADSEDKTVRKRFSSTSHVSLFDEKILELPPDSDLEDILKNVDTKRKKKRRRSSSSDDFETPKLKKRK